MIGVTDTAAAIARVRAEESGLPAEARLFEDPYAPLFSGDPANVTDLFLAFPFFREQVRLRTRFIDDFVRDGIRRGVRQLVILGAGFDCRALRLPEVAAARVRVFEVDFDTQLDAKRRILENAGSPLPDHVVQAPCDFRETDWGSRLGAVLSARGFDAGSTALFLLEGVVSYLEPAEIGRTLGWMAKAGAPGSSAAFNYNLARLDPAAVPGIVSGAGFRAVENHRFDDLYRNYLGGEPPPGGDLFHIAVARS